jgi:hypothetical protein
MINKDNYVTAQFIDEGRKNIEVLLNMDHTGEKELTPHVIEADENNKDYQDLLKLVTEDQLHEQTWENKKAESEAFMAMAQNIAKDTFVEAEMIAQGAIDIDSLLTKTKIYPTIVDTLFTNMENEDHLFALKLALFEVQEIRESKDTAAKTAMRKGTNKIEVLEQAFKICGVRQTKYDDPSVSDAKTNDDELQAVEATPMNTDPAADHYAGVKIDPPKGAAEVAARPRAAGQRIKTGTPAAKRKNDKGQASPSETGQTSAKAPVPKKAKA